jgi:hypothetical protein
MTCQRCPAEAVLESLLPGPEGGGLVTEWICRGCAREKMGLSREAPAKAPKKVRKFAKSAEPAVAEQKTLFE